jgi:opacity protein-like surface antigen
MRFSGQTAYRNSSALDQTEWFVDFLQLEYLPIRTDSFTAGIQVGRMKLSPGLYGKVIDVAAAWPTALLSEALYPNRFRSTMIHTDGISVVLDGNAGGWNIRQELMLGRFTLNGDVVQDTWFRGYGEVEDPEIRRLHYSRTEFTSPDGSLLLGGMVAAFDWHVDATATDVGTFAVDLEHMVWFLYLSKQWQAWQLDIEYARYDLEVDEIVFAAAPPCGPACQSAVATGFDAAAEAASAKSDYSSISLYYNFPGGITLYGGAGLNMEDINDPRGDDYARLTGNAAHSRYVKQVFAGARYDLTRNWSVAGLVSYFEGSRNVMGVLNENPADIHKYWTAVHVSASYRF